VSRPHDTSPLLGGVEPHAVAGPRDSFPGAPDFPTLSPVTGPRVVFVQPHQEINIHPVPRKRTKVLGRYLSLGIATLAAYLREHDVPDVHVIDSASPLLTYQQFEDQIRRLGPDVVGITATTIDWPECVALARIVKAVDPDILVVVGGFQMNCYPRECLEFPCIDVGVVGDGEETLLELVEARAAGRSLAGIAGTWQKDERGVPVAAPPRAAVADLDSLPRPARELFPEHLYRAITIRRPFATMTTVRGCPYSCKYCGQVGEQTPFRMRSAEAVADEMIWLKSRGYREIIFFDETFTVHRARTRDLCERLIAAGTPIPWTCRTRVDLVDKELLTLMRRAGCSRLQMGIESGSEAVLKRMDRRVDLVEVEQAFAQAAALGFETRGYFMLGYLDETQAETDETIALACRMPLDWASFSRTLGLPGTPLYDEMISRGIVDGDFWKRYTQLQFGDGIPYCKDEAWLQAAQRRAYRKFFSRPSVLAGKLRDMTSPHRVGEYLHGARLFLSIQTEANRSVPSELWRRTTSQEEVALDEIKDRPASPSRGGFEAFMG